MVEGTFEAVQLWSHQLMMRFGIPAADVFGRMLGEAPDGPDDHEGTPPNEIRELFGRQFGIGYLPSVVVDRMASAPAPKWARQDRGDDE